MTKSFEVRIMIEQVKDKFIQILGTLESYQGKARINYEQDFQSLGLDSLDLLRLIVAMEAEYEVEFIEEELIPNHYSTLAAFLHVLCEKIGQADSQKSNN